MKKDFITDVFARMDVQQIREFLLYGADDERMSEKPYSVRIREASDPIYRRLESLCPDKCDHEQAANDLSQALAAHDAIYMEIGMKAGARLIHQLLLTDNPIPQENGGQL